MLHNCDLSSLLTCMELLKKTKKKANSAKEMQIHCGNVKKRSEEMASIGQRNLVV